MGKQEKQKTKVDNEDVSVVRSALEKCRGTSKREVLNLAAKLNAKERLSIIKHFEIEPQCLADTILLFWVRVEKTK